jgi:hypothetical protein
MGERTGTTGSVVSVQTFWRRDGTGRLQRRQRVRVEYSVGEESHLAVAELSGGAAPLSVGDHVAVWLNRGHQPTITPHVAKRVAATRHVRNGVLAYAGLVVLILLISGGIWFQVTSNPHLYLPAGSPPAPSTADRTGLPGSPAQSSPVVSRSPTR